MFGIRSVVSLALMFSLACHSVRADSPMRFGFAKVDITPSKAIRLSGYGSRQTPSEGIDGPLHARAAAIEDSAGNLHILASIDAIGVSAELTKRIAELLNEQLGVPRSRFVLSATHSHATPQLVGVLPFMFAEPMSEDEQLVVAEYSNRLVAAVVEAATAAAAERRPGTLTWAETSAGFAMNRRLVSSTGWTGFGETPGGPVDHHVPVLAIRDESGEVRGVLFNYACHCTTLGGEYNRIHGDWAAIATDLVEHSFPGSVALCTIGAGADSNPAPRGSLELARQHGRELAVAVVDAVRGGGEELSGEIGAAFGYAALPIDRLPIAELRRRAENDRGQRRRHAEAMLEIEARMGRLPESFPAPVQAWTLGDLAMVFLGGEVVVDYALRLRNELPNDRLWVSAYCNDVFAYVASERLLTEGGYEVDDSMIYYGRPGRWLSGVEDLLVGRIHDVIRGEGEPTPLSSEQSRASLRVAPGFRVDLVAAEPLVQDPINVAFGDDGTLWVTEMADYPTGADGKGAAGGRVKRLHDDDGDGRFDRADLFLDGLNMPNAVYPWRDGVVVAAAPEIFFAADDDGDGRADRRETILSGFRQGNPQHRVNGFEYGLDGRLYAGHGEGDYQAYSPKQDQEVNLGGRDFAFDPDSGAAQPLTGQSGYVRSRDVWGDWFLGDNSRPIRRVATPERYLRLAPYLPYRGAVVDLIDPPINPPVYALTSSKSRFNDLGTAGRFTSACSPHVYRGGLFPREYLEVAFICEPVHNLVHRTRLIGAADAYAAERFAEDAASEFLASTDPYFRPVRVTTGPDGALWIADMYRLVIEHPQWIPDAWQARLDLRSGEDQGRIYRVSRVDDAPAPLPKLGELSDEELVDALQSPVGPLRDAAARLLDHRGATEQSLRVAELMRHSAPEVRIQAAALLTRLGSLADEQIVALLQDADPRVRRFACLTAEDRLVASPQLVDAVLARTKDDDLDVRRQATLSLAMAPPTNDVAARLVQLLGSDEPVVALAAGLAAAPHSSAAAAWIARGEAPLPPAAALAGLAAACVGAGRDDDFARLVRAAATNEAAERLNQFLSMRALLEAPSRAGRSWRQVEVSTDARQALDDLVQVAAEVAHSAKHSAGERVAAVRFLGVASPEDEVLGLADLLGHLYPPELQSAAAAALAESGKVGLRLLANRVQNAEPSLRGVLLTQLIDREAGCLTLLEAVDAGACSASLLGADVAAQLAVHPNEAVRREANRLLSVATSSDREAVIERYRPVLETVGDARRGAKEFEARCSACHRIGEVGRTLGPELAALRDRSGEFLLVAVLDPNRAVDWHYHEYHAVLRDGRVLSGLVVEQNASSVTLADRNGRQETLARGEIEELIGSDRSFMPEGLETDLSVEQLADLFAFIQSATSAGGVGG